jgi:hypothetical protein
MAHIELRSKVDSDGMLVLAIPVGLSEANSEVNVTVDSISSAEAPREFSPEEWNKWIESTAGKWQGEPLTRPDQGEFEIRNEWA